MIGIEDNPSAGRLAQIRCELDDLAKRAADLRRERDLLMASQERVSNRSSAALARYATAKALRAEGLTYAAVGRQIGCSGQRAKQIISNGDYKAEMATRITGDPMGSISVRTQNCLKNRYGEITPDVILRAASELDALLKVPNFGRRSAREVSFLADALAKAEAHRV